MNEKAKFAIYKSRWTLRKLYEKITGKACIYHKISKKRILTPEDANAMIYRALMSEKPFACVRYGMAEIGCAMGMDQDKFYGTNILPTKMKVLGPFEEKAEVARWLSMVEQDSKEIDLCAVWFRSLMEDWVYQKYAVNADFFHCRALEPYYFAHPWSEALAGKKVLVINPFDELIRQQYEKRELLFANKSILPEFTLLTMPSVWYIQKGSNPQFKDWFEAMEYMKSQLKQYEFDVAIIGCGPFGFHLAGEVKRMGKQAVVLGGAVQILFGIKGKRWDDYAPVKCLYNEFWIRPEQNSKPKGAQILDKGCYW